jgi:hypothetical protein
MAKRSNTVLFNMRIPRKMKKAFEQFAAYGGRNMTSILLQAIDEILRANGIIWNEREEDVED